MDLPILIYFQIFMANPLVEFYPHPPLLPDTNNDTNPSTYSNTTTPVSAELTAQPNTALLSLMLTLGTFTIAYFLKIFRNGKHLGRTARRALGDFGIPIAILIMVLIDFAIQDTYTEKLDVPDGLEPTNATKVRQRIVDFGKPIDTVN